MYMVVNVNCPYVFIKHRNMKTHEQADWFYAFLT